jgi:hypothetical protein
MALDAGGAPGLWSMVKVRAELSQALTPVVNPPVLAIIANPARPPATRLQFASSLAAFAVGCFGLKPAHHVLWHWAAAAGQAAGVAAVVHHPQTQ